MKTRDKRRKLMRLNKVCVYSILWYTVSWSTTWSHCLSSVSHTISVIHFGGSFHLLFGSASAAQVITMIQMNEWMNGVTHSLFSSSIRTVLCLSFLFLRQTRCRRWWWRRQLSCKQIMKGFGSRCSSSFDSLILRRRTRTKFSAQHSLLVI